jgi:hypothetical protein
MNTNTPNDRPAFPTAEQRFPDGVLNVEATYGMTLREYYAGEALQGFCANPNCLPTRQEHLDDMAIAARRAADALLKEMSK